MKNINSMEELREILDGLESRYYGLRGASEHDFECVERGYLDCSLDLWDERDCAYKEGVERLPGTSAIEVADCFDDDEIIRIFNMASWYATNHHGTGTVFLIADKYSEYGSDEDEVVLGHNGYGADIIATVSGLDS